MSRDIERLFVMLGISGYTNRHIEAVRLHLDSGAVDPKELLNSLGEWEDEDLKTVEVWYNTL